MNRSGIRRRGHRVFTALFLAGPVLAGLAPADSAGAECKARSGPQTATVVELYTSEGCSSCPPADRWFSRLPVDGTVVPLAFHVDYWDRLGWADRFAQPAFTNRQRERSIATGGRFVYTPQVRVDGRDAPRWSRSAVPEPTGRPAGATLEMRANRAGGRVDVSLSGRMNGSASGAVAWLALTESGLSSDVRAGENKGARLVHDHVVRGWKGPFAVAADGTISAAVPFDAHGIDLARARLSALVERPAGPVVQALTLPLASCPPEPGS